MTNVGIINKCGMRFIGKGEVPSRIYRHDLGRNFYLPRTGYCPNMACAYGRIKSDRVSDAEQLCPEIDVALKSALALSVGLTSTFL